MIEIKRIEQRGEESVVVVDHINQISRDFPVGTRLSIDIQGPNPKIFRDIVAAPEQSL